MTESSANPLLQPWQTPFGLPPFEQVRPEHYGPAFTHAMQVHRTEADAIAQRSERPTFDNTIAAYDRCGRDLGRIARLFFNLAASETSAALQAVEREISPRLAAHYSAIRLHAGLFARIDEVFERREELQLTPEQLRLTERIHLDFVREGARLPAAARARYGAIQERLAELTTRFSQNVLADETGYRLVLRDERDLAGLPQDLRAAARAAAQERGETDVWIVTLSRSLIVPFLTFSDRRDLREQAFIAWTRRGEHDGEHDNRPVAREILALRNEQARLHGYRHYADYALVDRMAGTPEAVARLLEQVWEPAKAFSSRYGSRPRHAPPPSAKRWARWRCPTARSTPSSRGTGVTTPKRCARRATGWTTPR